MGGWLIPAPSGRSTRTPSPVPSPAASVRVTGHYGARASDRPSDRQGRAVAIEQRVSANIVHLSSGTRSCHRATRIRRYSSSVVHRPRPKSWLCKDRSSLQTVSCMGS